MIKPFEIHAGKAVPNVKIKYPLRMNENEKDINFLKIMVFNLANNIQKSGKFKVFIFCNSTCKYINNDIEYIPLKDFFIFCQNNIINFLIICDVINFIPFGLKCANIKNMYAILFNLTKHSCVIPHDEKLKNIFCLNSFHLEYLKKTFLSLANIITVFEHGTDLLFYNTFIKDELKNELTDEIKKDTLKFIYTSDFRKGLIPLLQMWPDIINKYPYAQLYIHSKLEENTNSYEMVIVKNILDKYKNDKDIDYNIIIKEYTNKKDLIKSWYTSDIWFYPCTYNETFCYDIMTAAMTQTLIVTTKIKTFETYIEDRGILFDINNNERLPYDSKWQKFFANELLRIIENKEFIKELVVKNFNWVNNMTWEKRSEYMIENYFKKNLLKNLKK